MTRFEFLLRRFRDRPSRLTDYFRSGIGGWLAPRYRRPVVRLFIGSITSTALGDNLMLTTVAREVKKRNPKARIEVLTNVPEIFERNPDVDLVRPRTETDRARFRDSFIHYGYGFPYRQHFLEYCCACVNITDPIELRTYIYPSPQDQTWADAVMSELSAPPILINRGAGSKVFRKTWPLDSWQKLVEKLVCLGPVLDIGFEREPLETRGSGYSSLAGQTTVHQLAALMAKSRALISVDSGPVHLAAAFDLPTVCMVGGVYPAAAIQYPNSRVLTDRPACADCAPLRQCDFNVKCMAKIHVETVLAALDDLCPGLSSSNCEPRRLSTALNG